MRRLTLFLAALTIAASAGFAQQIRPDRYLDDLEVKRVIKSGTWPRTVTVCTAGGDYPTLAAALTAVAAKPASLRNAQARWTILLCSGTGATDPLTFTANYPTAPITVPAWTNLSGMWTGHNNPVVKIGGVPQLVFTATSGTMIKLGAGASLTDLSVFWFATPSAAVKIVDHLAVPDADTANNNAVGAAQITNVSITTLALSNAFAVDGITETAGGLYIYGGGVILEENALGRAVVNMNTTAGLGISVYGGRYGGSVGCADLFRNAVNGGTIKLFEGVRIDAGCTNDLTKAGTGAVEVYGGVTYGPVSGVITNGRVHVAYAAAQPATCSPGEIFVDSTAAAPRACFCTATDTWSCAQGKIVSAAAPYACAAGVTGDMYLDTTTPSPCWCSGSAWTPIVGGGDCT